MTMQLNQMLSLIVVIFAVDFASGQVILLGGCPKVTVVQDFQASQYLGYWYEVEKYPAIFELGGKCVTANYSLNSDGTIAVINSNFNSIINKEISIIGEATFAGSPSEAKLSVVFTSLPVRFHSPYWVLDTDYNNYAVVWSCLDLWILNIQFAWILTRSQSPVDTVLDSAYSVFDKNGISRSYLTNTTQADCN